MDRRTELKPGTVLAFPGMNCVVESCVGRGSNALVYEAGYNDALNVRQVHRVLIKELFPYEVKGHIWRDERQCIQRDELGEEVWKLHRLSFERGNDVHLRLLAHRPDQIGGNLNTFALNQTLYTILDYTGGRSLDRALSAGQRGDLKQVIARMRKLLDVLSTFHERDFLHLDISLDNVLLVGQGGQERVLLIDYNSVHTREELQSGAEVYFSAKEGFTAPEVDMGMVSDISACTDIFSVCCIFYTCLVGRPPDAVELNMKRPPDASDSPLLSEAPATVKAQIRRIMRRGLCVLPDRRYQSCADMLRDLDELERLLDGVGVTHAALWEAGQRGVQRLTRRNPSLSYLLSEAELYPLRISLEDGSSMAARSFISRLGSGEGESTLLVGDGGMGKSTALLRAALDAPSRYLPGKPAVIYLPLMSWNGVERNFILNSILSELKFDARTKTMEDARHALVALLDSQPARQCGARLLLLLDGLNEIAGDISALIEEINRLSALPGLKMVIASRVAPDSLAMPRASMMRLTDGDVSGALMRNGLLPPERDEMRKLLRMPMMLSLFIQTARNTGGQVLCQSESELLGGYLSALCAKAASDAGRVADYKVEAAVKLVLPAIAREMRRQGRPLDDRQLHRVVERFYSIFRGKALARTFPELIGHSREALGGADSAEEWHGEIVQEILWRRLGLLVRDGSGRYRIVHQILQDYLAARCADNAAKLRARRARIIAITGAALALIACMLALGYGLWLRPKPYDAGMSAVAIDAAALNYVNCGLQYEAMRDMLLGVATPEECAERVKKWGAEPSRSAQLALEDMRLSGEVISWSNQPFELDGADELVELPAARRDEYLKYIRAYQLVSRGETGTTQAEFDTALGALLEADADIAWLLDSMVCMPHVASMSESQRLSYDTGLMSLPVAQENRTVDISRGLDYALDKAREQRRIAQNALNQLTVMHDAALEEYE